MAGLSDEQQQEITRLLALRGLSAETLVAEGWPEPSDMSGQDATDAIAWLTNLDARALRKASPGQGEAAAEPEQTEDNVQEQMRSEARAAAHEAAAHQRAEFDAPGEFFYDRMMAGWRITVHSEPASNDDVVNLVAQAGRNGETLRKIEYDVPMERTDSRVRALANQIIEHVRSL